MADTSRARKIAKYEAMVRETSEQIEIQLDKMAEVKKKVGGLEVEMVKGQKNLARYRYGSAPQNGDDLFPYVKTWSEQHLFNLKCSTLLEDTYNGVAKNLALCPIDNSLFASSSIDHDLTLWKVEHHGDVMARRKLDCPSDTKIWPQDMVWHHNGKKLFLTYGSPRLPVYKQGGFQVAIVRLKSKNHPLKFLKDKPHTEGKGHINRLQFVPWDNNSFITCGDDHQAVMWKMDEDKSWKTQVLHKKHSAAVMGGVGTSRGHIITVGLDRRIIGYDVEKEKEILNTRWILENKLFNIVGNPIDSNLFMIQTATSGSQIRLVDLRAVGAKKNE